jgi:hypothetical protein
MKPFLSLSVFGFAIETSWHPKVAVVAIEQQHVFQTFNIHHPHLLFQQYPSSSNLLC